MASDSPAELRAAQAARLDEALDVIEARLDAVGAGFDDIAAALAEPVRNFDAAAKEALR